MGYTAHVTIPQISPAIVTTVGPNLCHGWVQVTTTFTKVTAKCLYICVFTYLFTLEAGVEPRGRGLAGRGSAGLERLGGSKWIDGGRDKSWHKGGEGGRLCGGQVGTWAITVCGGEKREGQARAGRGNHLLLTNPGPECGLASKYSINKYWYISYLKLFT